MKQINTKELEQELKKQLDHKRFYHTIGVAYTATALAMRYEADLEKAKVAGLLHDCAKCIPPDKKLAMCKKYNIQMTDVEYSNPFLLHAKLGAFLAMKKYQVSDEEIISAILNHTTGKPDMSLLDKIVYVADYIEPHRNKAPRLSQIRKQAFIDLDEALYMILSDTLVYLQSIDGAVDPVTQRTFEFYANQRTKEAACTHESNGTGKKGLSGAGGQKS